MDNSEAVVPVLVLLFVALWFILRGDLIYVLPCVILFLCFSILLALRLPRLAKRELILVLYVRLFNLRLFGFVFPFPLGVWKGLRFVIVALPGLFSYLFSCLCVSCDLCLFACCCFFSYFFFLYFFINQMTVMLFLYIYTGVLIWRIKYYSILFIYAKFGPVFSPAEWAYSIGNISLMPGHIWQSRYAFWRRLYNKSCFFPQERGLIVPTRLNHINEKTRFII